MYPCLNVSKILNPTNGCSVDRETRSYNFCIWELVYGVMEAVTWWFELSFALLWFPLGFGACWVAKVYVVLHVVDPSGRLLICILFLTNHVFFCFCFILSVSLLLDGSHLVDGLHPCCIGMGYAPYTVLFVRSMKFSPLQKKTKVNAEPRQGQGLWF